VIYSEKTDQCPDHVTLVINRLRDEGLMTKPTKLFAVQEIFLLGHRVSTLGTAIDLGHMQATHDFPSPKYVNTLLDFGGW
jgi:hypothetical protein